MPSRKQTAKAVTATLMGEIVLPPDPQEKNDDRAEWAGQALEEFARITGMSMEHDKPEVVGDFLADLHHWCDRNGIDFDDRIRNGAYHYAEDTRDE